MWISDLLKTTKTFDLLSMSMVFRYLVQGLWDETVFLPKPKVLPGKKITSCSYYFLTLHDHILVSFLTALAFKKPKNCYIFL